MTYGIIFWENSADGKMYSNFRKRAIRLITNSSNRTSCSRLFKKLDILPLQSQYMLSLALFVIKNMEIFAPNSDIHTKNNRNKSNLFLPQTRLTKYQKGVYFACIKIFNHLPPKKLRNCLITQINLKENSRISFYLAHFTLLKNSVDGLP
jgi:hypothetical protein